MKTVLIISYHFPPDSAIGAVRPAELAKHLPEFGWTPVVLSISEKYYDLVDSSRYRELPVEVCRTSKVGSINGVYLYCKSVLLRIRRSPLRTAKGKEWFAAAPDKESLRAKVLRYYNSLLIYLPDKEIGWLFFAAFKGFNIIKQKRVDAFFTTSPPHSVQLIGLLLKLFTGKIWIADFRDPWSVDLKPQRSRSMLSDLIERGMEKAIVTNCDWVVSVTDKMTRRLKQVYPHLEGKFITIPNGYDSEELSKYLWVDKYQIFTITYVGSLYFGRSPLVFLTAVADLIKEGRIKRDAIRIRFVGDCRVSDGQSVEQMAAALQLDDLTAFLDPVPQHEALREIAKSQVLLLMAPCQPLQIPGKVYEYIGLRTAILAVCEEGATKDLLQSYPRACVVSPGNVDEMKAAIRSLYEGAGHGQGPDTFRYEKYERRTIAREVACLLSNDSSAMA